MVNMSKRKRSSEVKHKIECDNCSKSIVGTRWKCSECIEYDLCDNCYKRSESIHPEHLFLCVKKPLKGYGYHKPLEFIKERISETGYVCVTCNGGISLFAQGSCSCCKIKIPNCNEKFCGSCSHQLEACLVCGISIGDGAKTAASLNHVITCMERDMGNFGDDLTSRWFIDSTLEQIQKLKEKQKTFQTMSKKDILNQCIAK